MKKEKGITQYFGANLAELLSDKITEVYKDFNKKETGIFKEFYWILPIGKYIEKYGLENLEISISAIEEITKRNTGEYAIPKNVNRHIE